MKVNLFYCSLCRGTQTDREFIIAGPDNINICDRCVDLMVDILSDERAKKKESNTLKTNQIKSSEESQ